MWEEASDAALVVAIGRWKEQALAEAYRRHSGPVLALAQRILRNRALAEDVVQEVFVRLWRTPDKFDPGRGTLRSYLLAQAHGRAVDILRSEESRRRRETRDASEGAAVARPGPEAQIEDLAMSEEVRKAVGRLPESERDAILLSYFGGRTDREEAHFLSMPEGTIKSRIRTGLHRLRTSLAEAEVIS